MTGRLPLWEGTGSHHVLTMLDCHFWANHVMLDHLGQLTPEQYIQEIQSSFPSLQATVAHMLNSERFQLGNLMGDPLPKLDRERLQTVVSIRAAWAETEELWRGYIAGVDESALFRDMTLRFSTGETFPMKAWQVIHQLIVHGPYHRGQVITMLRQVGGKPFKTDALLYHILKLAQISRQ